MAACMDCGFIHLDDKLLKVFTYKSHLIVNIETIEVRPIDILLVPIVTIRLWPASHYVLQLTE